MIQFGDPTGGGWELVYLISLLGLGYFVGGAVLGARRKGEPLRKGPQMLKAHPHFGNWMQLHGLVYDGVHFSRARINAKSSRGTYQPVGVGGTPAELESKGDRQSSGAGRSKGKRSSKEDKPHGAKSKRDKKGSKSSEGTSRGDAQGKDENALEGTPEAKAHETMVEEKARLLREQRSAGVHSSQQAIKVVGLNG